MQQRSIKVRKKWVLVKAGQKDQVGILLIFIVIYLTEVCFNFLLLLP